MRWQLFATDQFPLPLPQGHRFPAAKYRLLREQIEAAEWRDAVEIQIPPAATDEQLLRVHTGEYLNRLIAGALSPSEIKALGFPWSIELVERSRRSSGATIQAAWSAIEHGFSANLAGGTHHAFADRAEGFCLFNDSAVAARDAQSRGPIRRVAVVDLDVHQGNGTAAIAANDPTIFTFSMHCVQNYPFRKETSDWDIELPAGTGDDAYLASLETALPQVLDRSAAELVIYLAGADPYEHDRMGRLKLTKTGLVQRDRLVLSLCRDRGIPIAVSMAGGYAANLEDIVEIHLATISTAVSVFGQPRRQ
jgi:acetoin utilization deacetylase AcuC-like enzyme